jgi:hypothetical protein
MSQKYINVSAVKKFVKLQYGKRVGKDFLDALNRLVERKLVDASREHNGGKKTLCSGVAHYIIGK